MLNKKVIIEKKLGTEQNFLVHKLNETWHERELEYATFYTDDEARYDAGLVANRWNNKTDITEYLGHPLYELRTTAYRVGAECYVRGDRLGGTTIGTCTASAAEQLYCPFFQYASDDGTGVPACYCCSLEESGPASPSWTIYQNQNISKFELYDNATLLERYLNSVENAEYYKDYTIGTFAFTFNNRKMTVLERFEVSHFRPSIQYNVLMSLLLLITLSLFIIKPIMDTLLKAISPFAVSSR